MFFLLSRSFEDPFVSDVLKFHSRVCWHESFPILVLSGSLHSGNWFLAELFIDGLLCVWFYFMQWSNIQNPCHGGFHIIGRYWTTCGDPIASLFFFLFHFHLLVFSFFFLKESSSSNFFIKVFAPAMCSVSKGSVLFHKCVSSLISLKTSLTVLLFIYFTSCFISIPLHFVVLFICFGLCFLMIRTFFLTYLYLGGYRTENVLTALLRVWDLWTGLH